MRSRVALSILLVALMAGFGLAVYTGLGVLRHLHDGRTAAAGAAVDPSQVRPLLQLPGSVYVASAGDLLRLRGDTVTRVLTHDAGRRWMQPAVLADGSLLVVGRGAQSSDLYSAGAGGDGLRRLSDNAAAPLGDGSLERDHWAFHPRGGADGRLWYSYDAPKAGFRVDLAVWSRPAAGVATRWSSPVGYTGGDVEPLPLGSGAVIFVRHAIDGQSHIHSQLWLQTGPRDAGHALTSAGDDCGQPDLAPGGGMLAMVCTGGGQAAHLAVAGFDGSTLGTPRALAGGALCAFPTWAPDGGGLAYLAPGAGAGDFTLWWLAGAGGSSPSAPRQVLEGAELDATSRPAWAA
ncbi:MAG TPA: hypothetical protein VGL20_12695 [Candidatus Dormibacteraeota bacterium]|jgi:hypothetical protein